MAKVNRRTFIKGTIGLLAGLSMSPKLPIGKKQQKAKAKLKKPTITLHEGTDKEITYEWKPVTATEIKNQCNQKGCCIDCDKKIDCLTYKTDTIILESFEDHGSTEIFEELKYNQWCCFQLNPEFIDIPGAKEWIQEVNAKFNTPEMERRFRKEFNRNLINNLL